MKWIPPVGATDTAQIFVDGNPAAGQKGSRVPAALMNAVQSEIIAAVSAAGLTPSGTDLTQLSQAIPLLAAQTIRYRTANAAGSANAITLTGLVPAGAWQAKDMLVFVAAATNTGATTVAGVNVLNNGGALRGGEIVSGQIVCLAHTGSAFQLLNPAQIVSALVTTPQTNLIYAIPASCNYVAMEGVFVAGAINASLIAYFSYDGGVTYASSAASYTSGGAYFGSSASGGTAIWTDVSGITLFNVLSAAGKTAIGKFGFYPGSSYQAPLMRGETVEEGVWRGQTARGNTVSRITHIKFGSSVANGIGVGSTFDMVIK